MKFGERKIDLLIYFDINLKTSLKRSQERDNRKFTKQEKETYKKFNDKLKDFIRYNNSKYSLLIIENNDAEEIIEILKKQMNISKYVIFGIPSTYFNIYEKNAR